MKSLQKTEKLRVSTMETNSKAYLIKQWTQTPHQVSLRLTFSTGTLIFDGIYIGAEVYRLHPNLSQEDHGVIENQICDALVKL